jgi:putative addiction module CopG family antidote
MQIELSGDLERFVESEIAKGTFQSAEEVVRRALEVLKQCLEIDDETERRIALAGVGDVNELLQWMWDDVNADIEESASEGRQIPQHEPPRD